MVEMYEPKIADGFSLENVWNSKSQEIRDEITSFWLSEGAISDRESALKRVDQVALVARDDSSGSIAGVCSLLETFSKQLESWVYQYRSFTAASCRNSAVGTALLLECKDFLNRNYKEGDYICGLMVIVQNEWLKQNFDVGRWVGSDMVFIGKTRNGDHKRIYYFDMARLFVPKPGQ